MEDSGPLPADERRALEDLARDISNSWQARGLPPSSAGAGGAGEFGAIFHGGVAAFAAGIDHYFMRADSKPHPVASVRPISSQEYNESHYPASALVVVPAGIVGGRRSFILLEVPIPMKNSASGLLEDLSFRKSLPEPYRSEAKRKLQALSNRHVQEG